MIDKKVALFGASGFLGTNLSKNLEEKGITINSISLRNNNFILEELNDTDVFINLIGKAHDHDNNATKKDFYDSNYEIVKIIYKLFIKSDASLFIHISSIAAIEELGSKEILSEERESNSVSWYGKSKYVAEEFLRKQKLPRTKKIVILRPTMIHGIGDKGNLRLLYKLINKGIPYPLAKFKNERSFLFIDNFNFIIEELIKKKDIIESGIYHVSDDDSITTLEIINIISSVTEKKALKLSLPKFLIRLIARIGDRIKLPLNTKRLQKMTSNLIVSNDKIKKALGIDDMPIKAKEGLIETIKSFNK